MNLIKETQKLIEEGIASALQERDLPELYHPVSYTFSLGGKRIRPVLLLLSAAMEGMTPKEALPAGLAVEFFHNFTLLHDDIMDVAPIRRGKPSVYTKYGTNTAILSGDALMIMAYEQLAKCDAQRLPMLLKRFNRCAIEVCEGQQLDINFESRPRVAIDEYLEMIRLKTSVLLGFSMFAGAYLARGDEALAEGYYHVGEKMGMAFQLQDDYLDSFGDSALFGKRIGGDILMNKKTYLLLKAMQSGNAGMYREIVKWLEMENPDPEEKIEKLKEIYRLSGAAGDAVRLRNRYYESAMRAMSELAGDKEAFRALKSLSERLLMRES